MADRTRKGIKWKLILFALLVYDFSSGQKVVSISDSTIVLVEDTVDLVTYNSSFDSTSYSLGNFILLLGNGYKIDRCNKSKVKIRFPDYGIDAVFERNNRKKFKSSGLIRIKLEMDCKSPIKLLFHGYDISNPNAEKEFLDGKFSYMLHPDLQGINEGTYRSIYLKGKNNEVILIEFESGAVKTFSFKFQNS